MKVSIPLNRELAKVFFNASVTTNPVYEAYGKMAIKDAEWENPTSTKDPDGIVVVRIPRRVSPFRHRLVTGISRRVRMQLLKTGMWKVG